MNEFDLLVAEIENVLEHKGIGLNKEMVTPRDIADYILTAGGKEVYSIDDWIEDTTNNYPGCLI